MSYAQSQLAAALLMLHCGLVLGLFYSVLRVIRLLRRTRLCEFICDVLFVLVGFVLSCVYLLHATSGDPRLFALLFCGMGFFTARALFYRPLLLMLTVTDEESGR